MALLSCMQMAMLLVLSLAQAEKYTDENRPYKFGFNIQGHQHRHEEKDENGIIKGEYGFITADGYYRITVYATDINGDFKIISMKNIYVGFPPEDPTTTPEPPQNRHGQALTKIQPRFQTQVTTDGKTNAISSPFTSRTPPPKTTTTTTIRPFSSTRLTTARPVYGCGNCIIPTTTKKSPILRITPRDANENSEKPRGIFPKYENQISNIERDISRKSPVNQNSFIGRVQPRTYTLGDIQTTTIQTLVTGSTSTKPGGFNHKQPDRFTKLNVRTITPSRERDLTTTPAYNNYVQHIPRKTTDSSIDAIRSFETGVTIPENVYATVVPEKFDQDGGHAGKKALPRLYEESDGLPPGVNQRDIMDLLYRFNYTVGFHGHHEDGYRNGDKTGDFFVDGRDGVERKVVYVANEFGYQPNITFTNLPKNDLRTPKEETEKQFGLKGYEFKWFYRR